MPYLLDKENVGFPDPQLSAADGFLAVGGSLEPLWLLNAYCMGIFPWYDDDEGNPYWYSLDPRMVLFPNDFRFSKSLERVVRSARFEVRVDTCFRQVMESCASVSRPGQPPDSWISERFIDAYCELHNLGYAHSFESFVDGQLVGGLYGVSLGRFFSGESMFHTVTDASKVAFARLVDFVRLHGFQFIDAQQPTNHLASLGARPIPRKQFLEMLGEQDFETTYRGRWCNNTVVLLLGGNQGERLQCIIRALGLIAKEIGTISRLSAVYETEPWGFEAEQSFLNIAAVVDTDLSAEEVLRRALQIEHELGRRRNPEGVGYQSRPMDIDLIFFNSDIVNTDALILPHPRMHLRRFVLSPLVEIMPDFLHPKLRKTMRELLYECTDLCEAKIFLSM